MAEEPANSPQSNSRDSTSGSDPNSPAADSAKPADPQDAIMDLIAKQGTTEALDENTSPEASIEELLKQANFEDASAVAPDSAVGDGEAFKLPSFQQVMADAQVSSIELLRDVELNVKIELGRSRMLVEDVLKLSEGSVVELDKLAGDPVDVLVNDRLVARGEVLVLNDNFCVRVNEIVAAIKEEAL
jgi:flagellar motor switch protein FliN